MMVILAIPLTIDYNQISLFYNDAIGNSGTITTRLVSELRRLVRVCRLSLHRSRAGEHEIVGGKKTPRRIARKNIQLPRLPRPSPLSGSGHLDPSLKDVYPRPLRSTRWAQKGRTVSSFPTSTAQPSGARDVSVAIIPARSLPRPDAGDMTRA